MKTFVAQLKQMLQMTYFDKYILEFKYGKVCVHRLMIL